MIRSTVILLFFVRWQNNFEKIKKRLQYACVCNTNDIYLLCVNYNTTATRRSGLTYKVMARFAHLVVFDGTSAYVIPVEDVAQEIEQNEVEVLGEFADFDEACDFCDKQNDEIIDPVH